MDAGADRVGVDVACGVRVCECDAVCDRVPDSECVSDRVDELVFELERDGVGRCDGVGNAVRVADHEEDGDGVLVADPDGVCVSVAGAVAECVGNGVGNAVRD